MVTPSNGSPLHPSDDSKINKFHMRMVITAGTGFFTDAYDLFVIGVVTAILAPIWHLTVFQLALLNGASLAAAAFGAMFFGFCADKFGRKKMYGIEVLILFFGAVFSAVSPSFMWLFISRIIVGFGIGGDYPTSAVVASEYSGKKNRGFLVLLVFAMQAVGLIVGPLLASLFLAMHMPDNVTWRILLGLGAIPAASVFYLRRCISETPHYMLSKKTPGDVGRAVSAFAGYKEEKVKAYKAEVKQASYKKQKLFSKKWIKCLIGTAGAWFLLDVAFYGNGVSSVFIMKTLSPHASILQHTLMSALIFLCFAVPGYVFAAKYVDKIGRKTLQYTGFCVMALCFCAIALIPDLARELPLFIALFGLSFFFVNFGPNTTTFLIPSEIYPTSIRATAHGLSAAVGKLGAFVGAFILPIILKAHGMSITMYIVSIVSLLGMFATTLVPEMKDVALESLEVLEEN